MGDPAGRASALAWSVTAMGDAVARLGQMKAADRPRAFAVIGEAVWWVTTLDATLGRHRVIEEARGGLRFVRNRMGDEADLAEFIGTGGPGAGEVPITAWRWKLVPQPGPGPLTPRGQAWEMTRYRAYLARLAGRAVGETFGCTAEVLT